MRMHRVIECTTRWAQRGSYVGVLITLLAAAGCGGLPFRHTEYGPLPTVTADEIRAALARSIPRRYQLENVVVLRFRRRAVSALGVASVDGDHDAFRVACLSHTGVKIFEVVGKGTTTVSRFALPMLTERGDYTRAVGTDIRRVYFDLVPSYEASVRMMSGRVVFVHEAEGKRVEHEVAGSPPLLIEKRYYETGKLLSRIQYGGYEWRGEQAWPRSVQVKNVLYGYTLTVRVKRIHPS